MNEILRTHHSSRKGMGRDCPTEESEPQWFTDECNLKIKALRDEENLNEDIVAPVSRHALPSSHLEIDGYACFGRRNGPCLSM